MTFPINRRKVLMPHIVGRDRENPAHPGHKNIIFVFRLFLGTRAAFTNLLHRGKQQEHTKNIENPAELLDEGGSQQDENETEHERQSDADRNDFLLDLARGFKGRNDDDKHKQVIQRQ